MSWNYGQYCHATTFTNDGGACDGSLYKNNPCFYDFSCKSGSCYGQPKCDLGVTCSANGTCGNFITDTIPATKGLYGTDTMVTVWLQAAAMRLEALLEYKFELHYVWKGQDQVGMLVVKSIDGHAWTCPFGCMFGQQQSPYMDLLTTGVTLWLITECMRLGGVKV